MKSGRLKLVVILTLLSFLVTFASASNVTFDYINTTGEIAQMQNADLEVYQRFYNSTSEFARVVNYFGNLLIHGVNGGEIFLSNSEFTNNFNLRRGNTGRITTSYGFEVQNLSETTYFKTNETATYLRNIKNNGSVYLGGYVTIQPDDPLSYTASQIQMKTSDDSGSAILSDGSDIWTSSNSYWNGTAWYLYRNEYPTWVVAQLSYLDEFVVLRSPNQTNPVVPTSFEYRFRVDNNSIASAWGFNASNINVTGEINQKGDTFNAYQRFYNTTSEYARIINYYGNYLLHGVNGGEIFLSNSEFTNNFNLRKGNTILTTTAYGIEHQNLRFYTFFKSNETKTIAPQFDGKFNWTTSNNYQSFNGNVLTLNETKLNTTINQKRANYSSRSIIEGNFNRSLNTNYQNTRGRPIMVYGSMNFEIIDFSAEPSYAIINSGNVSRQRLGFIDVINLVGVNVDYLQTGHAFNFIVENGSFYNITTYKGGGGANSRIDYWNEVDL